MQKVEEELGVTDRSYVVVKEVEEDSFLEEDVCGASRVECLRGCVCEKATFQLGFYLKL